MHKQYCRNMCEMKEEEMLKVSKEFTVEKVYDFYVSIKEYLASEEVLQEEAFCEKVGEKLRNLVPIVPANLYRKIEDFVEENIEVITSLPDKAFSRYSEMRNKYPNGVGSAEDFEEYQLSFVLDLMKIESYTDNFFKNEVFGMD